MNDIGQLPVYNCSFFERPGVEKQTIPIGPGIPIGIEKVFHPGLGIGGAYGAWGSCYDNQALPRLLEERLGEPLPSEQKLSLEELGFQYRHHIPDLPDADDLELELEVGTRFLIAACQACGWDPGDVEAVLIGSSGPVSADFTECIARKAGIPDEALI